MRTRANVGQESITRKTLGLVVVGYESEDVWGSFFDSLRSSSIAPSAIVMVENSPVLPNTESAEDLELKILHRPDNPGYGTAVNLAVTSLPPNITEVVVCNPDVTLDSQCLRNLLEAFPSLDRTAMVGPKVLTTKGEIFPSARAIPGIRIGIGHAVLEKFWKANPWTKRYLGDYEGSEPRAVGWLSGSFFLVSRKAFEEVGGFDEGYFMFFEDVDLCFRLKQAGYRSVYVPAASITHLGAHSTSAHMRSMVVAHHKSAEKFLSKLYAGPLYAPLRAVLRAGLRVRAVIASSAFTKDKN